MNEPTNDDYLALIHSDRVSAATRKALLERAKPDDPAYQPRAMDSAAFSTLRAVLARMLPQDRIDIAQRVDDGLAGGKSDGWRFAALAPDADAYRAALAKLADFSKGDGAAQDACLSAMAEGERGDDLKLWFEDLRGRATTIYVSHPSTFARMGYSGIAYGGDGPGRQGFHALAPSEREPWEPLAHGEAQ